MVTKTVSAKELQELDPKMFQTEYNDWLTYAPHHDWWDYIYDDYKERGLKLGFCIDEINFSGFWSQGDGASWDGSVYLPNYLAHHYPDDKKTMQILALEQALREDWVDDVVSVTRFSHSYAHSNTMASVGISFPFDYDDEDVFTGGVFAGTKVGDILPIWFIEDMEIEITENVRAFADEIYDALEAEYEHLTSEETFIESCECNEVTFEIEVDDEDDSPESDCSLPVATNLS